MYTHKHSLVTAAASFVSTSFNLLLCLQVAFVVLSLELNKTRSLLLFAAIRKIRQKISNRFYTFHLRFMQL
jgi:hypothetical protein